MPDPLRLGIAGCAGSRHTYGAAARLVEGIAIAALLDPDLTTARSWVRSPRGIPVYANMDEMLQGAGIDAVLVSSPGPDRARDAAQAAAAGWHILFERPAAAALADLTALECAVREAGVVAAVGVMKRHDTAFRAAADLIADGAIGEPTQAQCDWRFFVEWEEHSPDMRSWPGVLREFASQTVDVCRWWLGDVHTVSADVDLPERATARHELGNMILTHERGISVHHFARTRQRNAIEQYLLRGTQGSLHISMPSGWSYLSSEPFRVVLQRRGHEPEDLTRQPLSRSLDDAREHNPYVHILNAFAERVATGEPDPDAFTGARQALEVVVAAYLSTLEKAKISIPLGYTPVLSEGW